MIYKVVDRRSDRNNERADVVFEPSWHDYDDIERHIFDDIFSIDQKYNIRIADAYSYINNKYPNILITAYLYDVGSKPLDLT